MTEPIAPPPPIAYAALQQPSVDESHLKILTICHWVAGGLILLFGSIPLIHIGLGIAMLSGAMTPQSTGNGEPFPEEFVGWMFVGIGSLFVLLGWTMGILTLISANCLRHRRRRIFSVVVAAIICVWIPIGTTLGVFTLVVLFRDSVKRLYGERSAAPTLQ